MRSARHPRGALAGRAPPTAAWARTRPSSTPRPPSRRARPTHVLVYRAFNERSGRRFGQPNAATTPPDWNWYLPFGLDTPAKIYSLAFQRYMDRYGAHQRGLRPVLGRRPTQRGDQPERLVLRPPDHARGPPGVALDRRADPAAARLLPGERRRGGDGRHHAPTAPRDLPQPGRRDRGRGRRASPRRRRDVQLLPRRPHRVPRGDSPRRASSTATTGLVPADIDVAMIYENFSPVVFLQLEALGFCGPGEARDFIADGHIDLDGSLPVNTARRPARRGLHPRGEQHPRRGAPDPRHRGQPDHRCRARPGGRRSQRHDPRPSLTGPPCDPDPLGADRNPGARPVRRAGRASWTYRDGCGCPPPPRAPSTRHQPSTCPGTRCGPAGGGATCVPRGGRNRVRQGTSRRGGHRASPPGPRPWGCARWPCR